MTRRCATCGRYVSKHHLATARYAYDIDRALPVAVYSMATATSFQERLDCPSCSMECCRMREAERERGVAVGRSLPGGWENCPQSATQADYATSYGWCEGCGNGLDDTNPPAGCDHATVCETCWTNCDECRIAADDDEGLWDE